MSSLRGSRACAFRVSGFLVRFGFVVVGFAAAGRIEVLRLNAQALSAAGAGARAFEDKLVGGNYALVIPVW